MSELLKSLACSGTECFSWILVLIDILAIFYLVFCSFWKVTSLVKIVGWVWIGILLSATIGILIPHTCIYTLLVTIFTAMVIMAILSVIIFRAGKEEPSKAEPQPVPATPSVQKTVSGTVTPKTVQKPVPQKAEPKPVNANTAKAKPKTDNDTSFVGSVLVGGATALAILLTAGYVRKKAQSKKTSVFVFVNGKKLRKRDKQNLRM